ncbi:preprotein translocase subunit YajC [Fusobacterium sp. PH5-44]|uniref:preprotein translocase subunit YajC n=1 Tax=unclassified Fusobacterium TaxID=2648384 RepID=UPI003D1FA38B
MLKGIDQRVIFGVLYGGMIIFFWMWSRNKKKKEKEIMESLREGCDVIIPGGIKGHVVKLDSHFAEVKIAKGFNITIKRASIVPISTSSFTTTTSKTEEKK